MQISAAVQKQVLRDLAPLWMKSASVDAFDRIDDAPTDYWPIIIRDNIDARGVQGAHWTRDGQPFALVQAGADIDFVCVRVSHEALEMLIDPYGNMVIAGASPQDPSDRVNFVVEVCDPVQGPHNGYSVNGLLVSDFVTPAYFGPISAPSGRYSYSGRVTDHHQVLESGYLSWIDPLEDRLWQAENVGGQLTVYDRGRYEPDQPMRMQSDLHMWNHRSDRESPSLTLTSPRIGQRAREAFVSRANGIQRQIAQILEKSEHPNQGSRKERRKRTRKPPLVQTSPAKQLR